MKRNDGGKTVAMGIEDYAVRQFPQGFSMTSSGMVPINVATSNEVVTSCIFNAGFDFSLSFQGINGNDSPCLYGAV